MKKILLPSNKLILPKGYAGPASGATTIDHVDAAIPKFWANIALGALKSNTVMARLVNRDYSTEVATRGDVVNVIQRGALQVNDKEKGKEITLQTPSNSKIPVTLDKHKEISWLIEDVASAKAVEDAINYVQDAAIAMAETIDKDLLLMALAMGNKVTATSGVLDKDTILRTREILNVKKCPVQGRVFVISPKDETALLKLEEFTKQDWSDENLVALREATLGRKFGFTFVMDQNVSSTEDAGNPGTFISNNIAFQRDAIALVTRPLPAPPANSGAVSAVVEEDGIAVRVTKSYDQRAGGVLWTLDVLYGVAAMRKDTHGVHAEC